MAPKIHVQITGDSSDLTRAYKDASRQTQTFGNRLGAMGKAAALSAGAAGLGLVTVALVESVKAAADAEKSQKLMETAVQQAGQSYKAHAAEIEKVVQATSKLSGLDDEALQDSFASLVRTTGDVGKALDAMSLAADVARGRNISLEAATNLVTKAELGKAGALTRAGIEVDANASKMELLATLQDKYAGSAKAYGETAAGANDRLRVAIENLEEKIGAVLIPVLASWAEKLTLVIDKADRLMTALAFLKPVVEAVATVIGFQFKAALALADVYLAILTTGAHVGAAALDVLKGAGSAVAGFFQGAWVTAVNTAKTVAAAFDSALDGVKAAFNAVRTAAGAVVTFLGGTFEKEINAAKAVLSGIARVADAVASALYAIANAARAAAEAIRNIPDLPSIPRIGIPGLPGIGIGGRASGGPVSRGTPYIVGENGPELFIPNANGSINPNHALAAGGGGNTYIFQFPNYIGDKRDLEDAVREAHGRVIARQGYS